MTDARLAAASLEVATSRFDPPGVTVATSFGVAAQATVLTSAAATVPFTAAASAAVTRTKTAAASVGATAAVTVVTGVPASAARPFTATVTAVAKVAPSAAIGMPFTATVTPTAASTKAAAASIVATTAVTATVGLPLATISAVELDADIAAVTVAGVVLPPPPTPEGTAGLQATITNPTLSISPGSLLVQVANGVPGHTVTLAVTGNSLPDTTATLDDSGGALGVNVPVAVTSIGSRTLTVTDNALGVALAGPLALGPALTLPFTVSSLATPGSYVVPSYTPPAAVQNTTGVRKWVFQDPASSDVYHFTYNPNQMTSPFGTKNIQWTATTAIDGQKLAFEGQQAPVQWQFQGFIRAQAEYDAFVYWQNKRNRIWITDHYGRAWLGYITQFDVAPRRAHNIPWSHDYTMHVLLFHGPVAPQ